MKLLWTLCGVLGGAVLCLGWCSDEGGTKDVVQKLHNRLQMARSAIPVGLSQGREDSTDSPKAMKDMMMVMTMLKNILGSLVMILSPVIQFKALGVAMVNTIVNLWRFFVQLQESRAKEVPNYAHRWPTSDEEGGLSDFREYDDSLDRRATPRYPFVKGVSPYKPFVGAFYQRYQ